jgi:NTP pyrophosphatase (non-canonical NTP hydrolase)
MDFNEYQAAASVTALYPNRLKNLEYPTLGLAGEAGEVANIVKKIQRDFGGEITDELNLTLAEIAEFNVEKLAKRHNKV